MARVYSDDLRKKLLKAHVAGGGTLRELAARFDVSVAWAWKISSAYRKSGSMERKLRCAMGGWAGSTPGRSSGCWTRNPI